jgi:capsular polysaccharide biosynthesis protein
VLQTCFPEKAMFRSRDHNASNRSYQALGSEPLPIRFEFLKNLSGSEVAPEAFLRAGGAAAPSRLARPDPPSGPLRVVLEPSRHVGPHRGFDRAHSQGTPDHAVPRQMMEGDPFDSYEQSYTRFPHLIYFPRMGLAMAAPGIAIWETSRAAVSFRQDYSLVPGYGAKGGAIVFDPSVAARTPQVRDSCLLSVHGSSMVYGHWMTDTLPSVWLWREALSGGAMKLMLPLSPTRKWQADSLELLGIPVGALFKPESPVLGLSDAVVSSSCSMGNVLNPPAAIREMGDHLIRSVGRDRDREGERLIYISRREANVHSKRDLVNEDELLAQLVPLGFEKVLPGQMGFREQIALFSNARMVIAPHGSALANLVFAPSNAAVIDLMPESWADTIQAKWIYRLTNMLSQRYTLIFGQMSWPLIHTDGIENIAITNRGVLYAVDIQKVVAAVRSML